MVHQHFMLVPVFTVAENVTLGAELVRTLATPAMNLGGLRVPALGLPSLGLLDRRRARRDVASSPSGTACGSTPVLSSKTCRSACSSGSRSSRR